MCIYMFMVVSLHHHHSSTLVSLLQPLSDILLLITQSLHMHTQKNILVQNTRDKIVGISISLMPLMTWLGPLTTTSSSYIVTSILPSSWCVILPFLMSLSCAWFSFFRPVSLQCCNSPCLYTLHRQNKDVQMPDSEETSPTLYVLLFSPSLLSFFPPHALSCQTEMLS